MGRDERINLETMSACAATALEDMRYRTVSEAMWQSLMVMPVALAELREARAEVERLRAGLETVRVAFGYTVGGPSAPVEMAEEIARLRAEQGGPCETCVYSAVGPDAVRWCCVMPDGLSVEQVERERLIGSANAVCEIFGGGCWAWRKRAA